ncbi:MAG: Yip1 family protein [Paracoccaceae bacterium]
MNLTVNSVILAMINTVRDARGGAQLIMAIKLNRRSRWEVLLLIAVLSALMAGLSLLIGGAGGVALAGGPVVVSPIVLGAAQLFLLFSMVLGIHFIGTRFGGHGKLDDAILLVAWLQFILISLQVIQIVAIVVLPPLAFVLGIAGIVLFFWLLTAFVAELHGFKSKTGVFVAILIAMVVFTAVFRMILGIFGIDATGVI